MEEVNMSWQEGFYKCKGGFVKSFIVRKEKAVTIIGQKFEMRFKSGHFGETDPKISELTGEKNFNIEVRFEAMGTEMVELGVLLEGGKKFFVKTLMGLAEWEWVPEEEGEQLAKDGDPIEAPPSHHKVQPERKGRLIWITGQKICFCGIS